MKTTPSTSSLLAIITNKHAAITGRIGKRLDICLMVLIYWERDGDRAQDF